MKKYSCFILLLFVATLTYGQQLTGKVIDASTSKPIANVNIQIVEVKKSTITDLNGEFKMALSKGTYQLVASSVGYVKQILPIKIPIENSLTISLSATIAQLDEVVISTGYQKIAKERATGSFSYLSNEAFNRQLGVDILSRLEGITPALSVDRRTAGASSGTFMVRGLSTLQGDRAPLIILDDFPYAGDLNNINPDDVANITLLKDAAAASIWGAKAGNGVIVITTKKGSFNTKMQITANAGTTLLTKPSLNEYNNVSSSAYLAIEQMLFSKGFYTNQENSTSKIPLSSAVELLIAARDGKITDIQLQSGLSKLQSQDIKANYQQAFFTQAINRQYNLSIKGGSEKSNWYLLGGYDDNKDALESTYTRVNFKVNHNLKLSSQLDFGLSLFLNQSTNKNGKPTLNSLLSTSNGMQAPYTQFADEAGNALPVLKNFRNNIISTLGNGNLLDWNFYALSDATHVKSSNNILDVLYHTYLDYKPIKGLKLGVNYQYERQNTQATTTNGLDSYYTRNYINQYTQVTGTSLYRPIPIGAIRDEATALLNVNNIRGQVNFDEQWGDVSLNVLGGTEWRAATQTGNGARTYGLDEQTLTSVAVDYVNPYPSIINGANLFIPYQNDYSKTITKYLSSYINGAVSYQSKYILSASARRDASNLFGVATNDLWNPLWSVGASWLLSEEKWLKHQFLPYARLRLTYGSSGNSDSKNAAVTTINYGVVNNYTRTQTADFSNYENPDLKWETVNTFNIGADFKWFGNRLSAAVDYYIKKSYDLIGTDPIDYTGGIGTQVSRNAAEISARGLDLEMVSLNTNGNIKWNTSLFVNLYKDKVDKYYLSNLQATRFLNGNSVVTGFKGYPVYSVFAYRWAGLNPSNGNPMGYNGGNISEDYATIVGAKTLLSDLQYFGSAFPRVSGAMGNDFKWNGFNLDFRVSFKFGYYFRRPSLSYTSLYNNRIGNAEYNERWQNPGDELHTNVPSVVYPSNTNRDTFYNYSATTISKGDHIRLQYIGLGYQFSKQTNPKVPVQSITLRAVANNLGLLWKQNKEGLDPDYPTAQPLKSYSFNLQITL